MHPDGPCGVPGCPLCELRLVEDDESVDEVGYLEACDKIGDLEVFEDDCLAGNPVSLCDSNGGRVNVYTNDDGDIVGVIGLQGGTVVGALGAFDADVLLEVLSDV